MKEKEAARLELLKEKENELRKRGFNLQIAYSTGYTAGMSV